MRNFHALEVVGRGIETQLQMGEAKYIIFVDNGIKRLRRISNGYNCSN